MTMRRKSGILFRGLLVLAIALTGFLWARSCVFKDIVIAFPGKSNSLAFASARGELLLEWIGPQPDMSGEKTDVRHVRIPEDPYFRRRQSTKLRWHLAGFAVRLSKFRYPPPTPPAIRCTLVTPYWSWICLCTIPLGRHAFKRHRLRKRRDRGLCTHCGYDLRSTPEVCPECGRSDGAARSAIKKPEGG
jgi:hypothetical protein